MRKVELSDSHLAALAQKQRGIIESLIISPSKVKTAGWVRLKCQFGCDGFGQCLVCPPFTPTPEQMKKILNEYKRAVLIHFTPQADTKTIIAKLERQVFLEGAWKAQGLGAGPCYFCKSCPTETCKCRHSEKARPSMEACGIDVFSTVRQFGLPINVVSSRKQCPNFYGLLLVD